MHRPNSYPGVDVPVEEHHADAAAVPFTRRVLQIFDPLHRRRLGCAGESTSPHVRQQSVKSITILFEFANYVVDSVNETGINLNQPPAFHLHRSGPAYPGLVVAIHVGAHSQLGLILGGVKQLQDPAGVLHRGRAALNRARYGTGFHFRSLDAHEHFRGCTDQLLVAQVDQKLVRTGIAFSDLFEQVSRCAWITSTDHLTKYHLEKIPTFGASDDLLHFTGILSRLVITAHRPGSAGVQWHRLATAVDAGGAEAVDGKIVTKAARALLAMVDDKDFIRQKQVEIRAPVSPDVPQFDGLELKHQVISHSPVKTEVRIRGRLHGMHQSPDNTKDCRLFTPLFFGEIAGHVADLACQLGMVRLQIFYIRKHL